MTTESTPPADRGPQQEPRSPGPGEVPGRETEMPTDEWKPVGPPKPGEPRRHDEPRKPIAPPKRGEPAEAGAKTAPRRREYRPGFLRRLVNTPLRDLVRGRVTAARDLRYQLAQSKLPRPLRTLVVDVVRRTRLWPNEQADVATELIAHFRDGREAGQKSDTLAAAFGSPRRAARLIRRAKRRGRPLAWRVWLRTAQVAGIVLALLVGIYVYATVRLFTGTPNVARDYLAELNAVPLSLPPEQRAWPRYQSALAQLGEPPAAWANDPLPGDPDWYDVVRYLQQHEATLAQVRAATRLDGLGFVAEQASDPGGIASILIPHCEQLRRLGRLLALDARRAAAAGDGEIAMADVSALLGLARQTREVPYLINELVALSMTGSAISTAGDLLADDPDLLSDEQLAGLAHQLVGLRPEIRLDGQQMLIEDLLQHLYTDDGNGGGRLTAAGLQSIGYVNGLGGPRPGPLAPVAALFVANRGRISDEYDTWFGRVDAAVSKPLWRQREAVERLSRELSRRGESLLYQVRYLGLPMWMGPLLRTGVEPELVTQMRDALIVAIALELYHRRTGAWPQSLAELVPDLLPRLPVDRFDGRTLRYRLVDGTPVVYSVGADGNDDGGRPLPGAAAPTLVRMAPAEAPDGDWVLWPPGQRLAIDPTLRSARE